MCIFFGIIFGRFCEVKKTYDLYKEGGGAKSVMVCQGVEVTTKISVVNDEKAPFGVSTPYLKWL